MAESIDTAAAAPERLQRGFSFRSALSLAFADVSPIAAVYAIFTLGLFAGSVPGGFTKDGVLTTGGPQKGDEDEFPRWFATYDTVVITRETSAMNSRSFFRLPL